jgi:hypothetical protein
LARVDQPSAPVARARIFSVRKKNEGVEGEGEEQAVPVAGALHLAVAVVVPKVKRPSRRRAGADRDPAGGEVPRPDLWQQNTFSNSRRSIG